MILYKRNAKGDPILWQIEKYNDYEYKVSYGAVCGHIHEEFINGKYRVYDNKVVLYFLHHVDRTKNVPDIDNLEIKVITDIITLFLLTDDDHKHVCHFLDMVEDDSSYTEIMIIPYKNFRT